MLVAGLSPVPTIHAEPPRPGPGPVLNWVRLEGARSCDDAVAMATRVEQRLGRPVFVRAPDAILVVEGTVDRTAEGAFTATLRFSDPGGEDYGSRALTLPEGEDCEALDAMAALIIAVTLRGQGEATAIPLPDEIAAMLDALFEPAPSDPAQIAVPAGPPAEAGAEADVDGDPSGRDGAESTGERAEPNEEADARAEAGVDLAGGLGVSATSGLQPRGTPGITGELGVAVWRVLSVVATATAGLPTRQSALTDSAGSLKYSSWQLWLAACSPELGWGPARFSACAAGGPAVLRVRATGFAARNGVSRAVFGQVAPRIQARLPLVGRLGLTFALLVPIRISTPRIHYQSSTGGEIEALDLTRAGASGTLGLEIRTR